MRVSTVETTQGTGMPAAVWLLAAGAFAIGTDTFVVAGVLPAVAGDLRVGLGEAGQAISVFALSFAVLAPVLAALTARVARRRLQITALSVFAVANIAAAFAPNLPVLLVTRVVAAAGAAAYTPAAAASAAMLVGPERRGRALALVLGGTTVATVAGVPVVALLGNSMGWRAAFALIGVLAALLAGELAIRLPALPLPPVASLRQRLTVLGDPRVLPAVLTTALFSVGGFMVYSYVSAPLAAAGAGPAMVSVLLGVFGIGAVAGNWLGGRLTDRFGAEPVLLGGLTVFAAALLAFSVVGASLLGAAVCLLVWAAAAWSLTVPQQHRMLTLAPNAPTVAIGLNSAAMFLGMGLAAMAGAFALRAGPARLAVTGSAVVMVALVVAVVHLLVLSRARSQTPTLAA